MPMNDSENNEDKNKAEAMAYASDQAHTELSGSQRFNSDFLDRPRAGLKEQLADANAHADELRQDSEKAAAKRGSLDSLHVREYEVDKLQGSVDAYESLADRQEEVAGIAYDLQHELGQKLSSEAIKEIKAILDKNR